MPATPEEIIDKEIEQLTQLRAMARNPQMVEVMRRILSASNGHASGSSPVMVAPIPGPPPAASKPERKSERKSAPNGLSEEVRNAAKALGCGFTALTLVDQIKATGFKFVSANPRVAVSAPLERLIKRGAVKLAAQGKGNQPNVYDYIG